VRFVRTVESTSARLVTEGPSSEVEAHEFPDALSFAHEQSSIERRRRM
jgi:hypothetical protein